MTYLCDETYEIYRYRFNYDENLDSFIVEVYKNNELVQKRLHITLKDVKDKYEEHFPDIEKKILNVMNGLKF